MEKLQQKKRATSTILLTSPDFLKVWNPESLSLDKYIP